MRPMIKATLLSLGLVGGSLSGAGMAFAQPHGGGGPAGEMMMHRELLDKLGLSDDQKQKLKAIHEAKKGSAMELHKEMRVLQQQFIDAMVAETSDASLRSLHDKVEQKRAQMGALRFEGMLEVRKILTPDQRKKFAELHQQHERGPHSDAE